MSSRFGRRIRTFSGVIRSGALHHIGRHEVSLQKGFGWEVAVRRGNYTYREYFADTVYGSKRKALDAAKQFRDVLLEELPPPLPIKIKSARNTTGVIGVSHSLVRRKSGEQVEYCIAYWPRRQGRLCMRKFSSTKYGKEEAFQMAIEARRQGVLEEFGTWVVDQQTPPPSKVIKRLKARGDCKPIAL